MKMAGQLDRNPLKGVPVDAGDNPWLLIKQLRLFVARVGETLRTLIGDMLHPCPGPSAATV